MSQDTGNFTLGIGIYQDGSTQDDPTRILASSSDPDGVSDGQLEATIGSLLLQSNGRLWKKTSNSGASSDWEEVDKKEKTVETISASSVISAEGQYYEQTSSGITTSLPASPLSGANLTIFNASSSFNTISGNGNTILTDSTVNIFPNESFELLFDGTEWKLI